MSRTSRTRVDALEHKRPKQDGPGIIVLRAIVPAGQKEPTHSSSAFIVGIAGSFKQRADESLEAFSERLEAHKRIGKPENECTQEEVREALALLRKAPAEDTKEPVNQNATRQQS